MIHVQLFMQKSVVLSGNITTVVTTTPMVLPITVGPSTPPEGPPTVPTYPLPPGGQFHLVPNVTLMPKVYFVLHAQSNAQSVLHFILHVRHMRGIVTLASTFSVYLLL